MNHAAIDTIDDEQIIAGPAPLQLFTAGSGRLDAKEDQQRASRWELAMIEVNDAKLSHYAKLIKQERDAAERATNKTIRDLHLKIAEMYEREMTTIRARS